MELPLYLYFNFTLPIGVNPPPRIRQPVISALPSMAEAAEEAINIRVPSFKTVDYVLIGEMWGIHEYRRIDRE